jgi:hypothetical protein
MHLRFSQSSDSTTQQSLQLVGKQAATVTTRLNSFDCAPPLTLLVMLPDDARFNTPIVLAVVSYRNPSTYGIVCNGRQRVVSKVAWQLQQYTLATAFSIRVLFREG